MGKYLFIKSNKFYSYKMDSDLEEAKSPEGVQDQPSSPQANDNDNQQQEEDV